MEEKKTVNTTSAPNSPMHSFNTKRKKSSGNLVVILLVLAVLGVGTGFLLATYVAKSPSNQVSSLLPKVSSVEKGKTYGDGDPTVFKDIAEGTVQQGGVEGEGQYHLVRPGGDSQNVYLTSSSVDLSQFIGKKVKVWGQTQAAQHAGWLMDVGKVEVE